MEKYRAIPDGYMRIGEMAKKAGTNINTLRYYDKEGLLSPSLSSEGGYRLYTDQDMVKLIQIQTMKELGFSLTEIKKYLVSLDTPDDMVAMLTEHEIAIEKRVANLSESLRELKALKAEIKQMQTMDFMKYIYILKNLQMKNENYWTIKYMDDDVLEHFRKHFEGDEDGAKAMLKTMNSFGTEVAELQKEGVSPESERGQRLAKTVMETMLEITDGNIEIMNKFAESIDRICDLEHERNEEYTLYNYVRAAVDAYIKSGYGGMKFE
ncbi:MAG: MerR family transcriptional regulator [Firmicutes bacterium]|nr:MerR family transcriptional regulator [Bacillota bacterium]